MISKWLLSRSKVPPKELILSQFNSVHTLKSCVFKIHFNHVKVVVKVLFYSVLPDS